MNGIAQKDTEKILKKIKCFYKELLKKYEDNKYNDNEYERLCKAFRSPESIIREDLEDALAWKYGRKTRDNLLKNTKHIRVVESFDKGWIKFVESKQTSGAEVFNYWKEDCPYISVAFIAHLIFPRDIPIVDQHTFRAVRYFLGHVGYNHSIKKGPNSLEEIQVLKEFVNYFSSATKVTSREFDKYLMMFGKHVAPR